MSSLADSWQLNRVRNALRRKGLAGNRLDVSLDSLRHETGLDTQSLYVCLLCLNLRESIIVERWTDEDILTIRVLSPPPVRELVY